MLLMLLLLQMGSEELRVAMRCGRGCPPAVHSRYCHIMLRVLRLDRIDLVQLTASSDPQALGVGGVGCRRQV